MAWLLKTLQYWMGLPVGEEEEGVGVESWLGNIERLKSLGVDDIFFTCGLRKNFYPLKDIKVLMLPCKVVHLYPLTNSKFHIGMEPKFQAPSLSPVIHRSLHLIPCLEGGIY
jgi:hypothetical protein